MKMRHGSCQMVQGFARLKSSLLLITGDIIASFRLFALYECPIEVDVIWIAVFHAA
jgi:hypothetical protein